MRHATAYALVGLLVAGCGQSDTPAKGNSRGSTPPQASVPPPPVTVSGQVFIVTKGRDNIKLALVEVAAIPENLLLEHIQKKHAFGLDQQRQMEAQLVSATEEANASARATTAAMRELEAARERVRAAWSDGPYRPGDTSEQFQRSLKAREEPGEKHRMATERASTARQREYAKDAAFRKARAAFTYFDKLAYYFTDLPTPQATSKTDADGRFTLTLPSGKYVLVATTSRRVVASNEVYYWLVSVDTSAPPIPLMLSNDNLLETKCSQCVQLPAPAPLPKL